MKLKWKRVSSGIYESKYGTLTFRVEKVPQAALYGPNWKVTCSELIWKQSGLRSKNDCYEYAEEFAGKLDKYVTERNGK